MCVCICGVEWCRSKEVSERVGIANMHMALVFSKKYDYVEWQLEGMK
jgi:hypothetical protein